MEYQGNSHNANIRLGYLPINRSFMRKSMITLGLGLFMGTMVAYADSAAPTDPAANTTANAADTASTATSAPTVPTPASLPQVQQQINDLQQQLQQLSGQLS